MSDGENGGDNRLRLLIERIERLEEEKKGIGEDIREVYSEAKAVGYDTKTMRQIIKLRKLKPEERSEQDALLDTYKAALGMSSGYAPATQKRIESVEAVSGDVRTFKGDAPVHMMSDAELEARKASKAKHDADEAAKDDEHAAKQEEMKERLSGEPLDQARAIVISKQNGSASWLQRQMGISFREAAFLVEALEKEGTLSEADLQGRRKVLKKAEAA